MALGGSGPSFFSFWKVPRSQSEALLPIMLSLPLQARGEHAITSGITSNQEL